MNNNIVKINANTHNGNEFSVAILPRPYLGGVYSGRIEERERRSFPIWTVLLKETLRYLSSGDKVRALAMGDAKRVYEGIDTRTTTAPPGCILAPKKIWIQYQAAAAAAADNGAQARGFLIDVYDACTRA